MACIPSVYVLHIYRDAIHNSLSLAYALKCAMFLPSHARKVSQCLYFYGYFLYFHQLFSIELYVVNAFRHLEGCIICM
jgi:hypothetical protein